MQGCCGLRDSPGMSSLFAVPAGRLAKWLVALGWLVVVVAIIGGNLPGKFSDAEKNESTSFLPGDAESTKALQVTERLQDGEKAATVIVYRRDGGLTATDRRAIGNDVAELNRITRRFDNTTPFGNPADPRSQTPYQLSEDETTALVANQITGHRRGRRHPRPGRRLPRGRQRGPQRRPAGEGGRPGRHLGRRDQGLRGHQRHAGRRGVPARDRAADHHLPQPGLLVLPDPRGGLRRDHGARHRVRRSPRPGSPSTASPRRSCPCSSSARGPTTRCCSSPATARSCDGTRTSTRRWRSRCGAPGRRSSRPA